MMKLSEFLKAVGGNVKNIVIYKSEKESIEAVKNDGYALQYVKDQSETICIEAVKSNGYALRYVKDQSETICIEAVKNDGDALRYVNISVFEIDIVLK